MKTLAIAEKVFDHYEKEHDVSHYYGIIALYGLVNIARNSDDPWLKDRVRCTLGRFPDRVRHGRYNFPSYTIGGIARAYAFYLDYMPESVEMVREYAEEMMTQAPRGENGIFSLIASPEKLWIDVATAVTPFLLYAGLKLGELRYLDEAVAQTMKMYNLFLDESCGLLHQSKNFNGAGKFSQDHWSRGNGWGYFPMALLVRDLPPDYPERPAIEKTFKAYTDSLIAYQTDSGMWCQEITHDLSYEETSGTGLILFGIGAGIQAGVLDAATCLPVFKKGLHGLMQVSITDDFAIDNSCPGCLCPGEGDMKGTIKAYVTLKLPYKDEPHGAGPVVMAFAMAAALGIDEWSV
ncbi:MAG: glycoside hydrolase family 88 protein [Bacillota bacterium]|nr:glycoside hydrolase family 88 protein [Bacillota bacterium]